MRARAANILGKAGDARYPSTSPAQRTSLLNQRATLDAQRYALYSQQSYGDLLLVVTSLGLLAYGLYQFVVARYRVIRPI